MIKNKKSLLDMYLIKYKNIFVKFFISFYFYAVVPVHAENPEAEPEAQSGSEEKTVRKGGKIIHILSQEKRIQNLEKQMKLEKKDFQKKLDFFRREVELALDSIEKEGSSGRPKQGVSQKSMTATAALKAKIRLLEAQLRATDPASRDVNLEEEKSTLQSQLDDLYAERELDLQNSLKKALEEISEEKKIIQQDIENLIEKSKSELREEFKKNEPIERNIISKTELDDVKNELQAEKEKLETLKSRFDKEEIDRIQFVKAIREKVDLVLNTVTELNQMVVTKLGN